MADLVSLLNPDPTQDEQQRALAMALRRKQNTEAAARSMVPTQAAAMPDADMSQLGQLATLGGGRLAPIGSALTAEVGRRGAMAQKRQEAEAQALEKLQELAQTKSDKDAEFAYRQKHDAETLAESKLRDQASLSMSQAQLELARRAGDRGDDANARAAKAQADKEAEAARKAAAVGADQKTALSALDELEASHPAVAGLRGAAGQLLGNSGIPGTKGIGMATDALAYESQAGLAAAAVAKAIGARSNPAMMAEIERHQPKAGDPPELAAAKVKHLRALLTSNLENKGGTMPAPAAAPSAAPTKTVHGVTYVKTAAGWVPNAAQ